MLLFPTLELVTRYVLRSLVLVNAVWLYFLIYGATAIHSSTAHKVIAIGPLVVNRLDKSPLPNGVYTLHLNFASGLLWLELAGVAIGTLAGILQVYLIKHNQKDNNNV